MFSFSFFFNFSVIHLGTLFTTIVSGPMSGKDFLSVQLHGNVVLGGYCLGNGDFPFLKLCVDRLWWQLVDLVIYYVC